MCLCLLLLICYSTFSFPCNVKLLILLTLSTTISSLSERFHLFIWVYAAFKRESFHPYIFAPPLSLHQRSRHASDQHFKTQRLSRTFHRTIDFDITVGSRVESERNPQWAKSKHISAFNIHGTSTMRDILESIIIFLLL